MQFITLKYFPLALCFFSWDFRAGEMISFVFIFQGKHHVHKGDGEGGGASHCKYMNGEHWRHELCLLRKRWQEAVDTGEWLIWLLDTPTRLPFKTLDLPWRLSLTEHLLFFHLAFCSIECPWCRKFLIPKGEVTPPPSTYLFLRSSL